MPHRQQGDLGLKGHSNWKYAYLLGDIPIHSTFFGINLKYLELLAAIRNHAELFRTIQNILNCLFVDLFVCLFVPFSFALSLAT